MFATIASWLYLSRKSVHPLGVKWFGNRISVSHPSVLAVWMVRLIHSTISAVCSLSHREYFSMPQKARTRTPVFSQVSRIFVISFSCQPQNSMALNPAAATFSILSQISMPGYRGSMLIAQSIIITILYKVIYQFAVLTGCFGVTECPVHRASSDLQ